MGEFKVVWDVITGISVEEDLEKKLAKVGLSKIKRLMRTANEERADRVSVMLYIAITGSSRQS